LTWQAISRSSRNGSALNGIAGWTAVRRANLGPIGASPDSSGGATASRHTVSWCAATALPIYCCCCCTGSDTPYARELYATCVQHACMQYSTGLLLCTDSACVEEQSTLVAAAKGFSCHIPPQRSPAAPPLARSLVGCRATVRVATGRVGDGLWGARKPRQHGRLRACI
jgi:hypothetical protein